MRPMFSSSVVAKIERAVQEVGGTTDTKEDLAFVTLQSKQCINSWKLDVIDELDETSVLLVLDWAKKYLPKKFRESQTDRFGKRGLPWHITVATRKGNDGKIEMMTFVHLFETCNWDSSAVLAILSDVFRRLKDVMPHLQSIYLRQDNAGYYHCALTLVTASKVAELNNLFLRRMDFSDPQGGKGSCDRKAATIKSHMAIHLNSGHDIESASQSFGGVPGVKAVLCRPPLSSIKKPLKWDGVNFVNNVQYGEEGVRVWRSYKIGRSKFIPWSKFPVPDQDEVPTLECSAASENIKANFVISSRDELRLLKHLKSTKTALMKVRMIQVKNRAIPPLKIFFSARKRVALSPINAIRHYRSISNVGDTNMFLNMKLFMTAPC